MDYPKRRRNSTLRLKKWKNITLNLRVGSGRGDIARISNRSIRLIICCEGTDVACSENAVSAFGLVCVYGRIVSATVTCEPSGSCSVSGRYETEHRSSGEEVLCLMETARDATVNKFEKLVEVFSCP